ncbi:MAG TPA: hypothetical protein VNA29_06840 [Sphingomicrobium sp.]|nr:hypothetical protein [Sphingomicrobium sp.]
MRAVIFIALSIAACSPEPTPPSLATGTFAGEIRDQLCLAGEPGAYRAGLIVYGEADANCSASGRLDRSGNGWVLIPRGEGECRIPMEITGNIIRIGEPPAACSYYCGPNARMAGKNFTRTDVGAAVDLTGDPLC